MAKPNPPLSRATQPAGNPWGRTSCAVALSLSAGLASSCQDTHPSPPGAASNMPYMASISEGPKLPQGRACHAGGVVGGRVVVVGGSAWSADRTTKSWLADSLVFGLGNAANPTWSVGPSLPHPLAEMMFAGDGDALYVAGGKNGPTTYADVYRVTCRDGQFVLETLPPLPLALTGGAAAMLDGVFYVAGGYDAHGGMTNGLWALDTRRPDAGWRARAAVPSPMRVYPGLAACGGALYILGGCIVENETNPIRQVFKDVHRYDPAADAWTRGPDLPTAGQGWVADAVDDHHLLLAGRGDTNIYDDIWLVDLRDSSVRSMGNLVIPSFGAPLVRVGSDRWWLIAGEPDAHKSRTPRVSVIRLPGSPDAVRQDTAEAQQK